jgi:hypothetical protein
MNIRHKECIGGHSRLYSVWNQMIQRTTNPNVRGYKNYGGRGISVCQEWLIPSAFIEWAKKNGYSDNLIIDRADNDKGYSPDNCHFVTKSESNINRRKRSDYGIEYVKLYDGYKIIISRKGQRHYGGFSKDIEKARVLRDSLVLKLSLI